MKKILTFFRSMIRFLERLFNNSISQIKWIWSKNSSIYLWLNKKLGNEWYQKISYFIFIIILFFIVLPLLLIWAFLKSV